MKVSDQIKLIKSTLKKLTDDQQTSFLSAFAKQKWNEVSHALLIWAILGGKVSDKELAKYLGVSQNNAVPKRRDLQILRYVSETRDEDMRFSITEAGRKMAGAYFGVPTPEMRRNRARELQNSTERRRRAVQPTLFG
jgi:hypothetical protein